MSDPTAMPAEDPQAGLFGGRYRIVGAAAPRGFDAVDRERDDAPVHVRLLGRAGEAAVVELRRRATLATGASILAPLEVGLDPASGRAFLVFARGPGEWLDALIARAAPLVPVAATRVICHAAVAVAAAHALGVVHGRLDPAWIWLRQDGDDVHVEVAGFGATGIPLDDSEPFDYQAPEQARPTPRSDERSDVWGLGAILYAALAGAAPLAHIRRREELRAALLTRVPPPLQEVAPWIPPRLVETLHGLLVRDPEQRCPTVDELRRTLEPRGGGDRKLRAAMLAPLSREQRAHRAPSANLPRQWSDVRAAEQLPAGAEPPPGPDPLAGTTIGDSYKLIRLLGRGGMAEVYEADSPDGRVAVKLILEDRKAGAAIDAAGSRRLAREARATRSVEHPNVVRVVEVGVDRRLARPFIAMELLRGRDLGTIMKSLGALDPRTAARLFVQICRGLEAVHQQGIVHRDVKPANVILHEDGEELVAKVCDFGLAKLVGLDTGESNSLTKTGMLLGSPRYMSPEQARDARSVNVQSDVWSLAAALYETLSGTRIWGENRHLSEIILDICSREPPPLGDLAPWLDPALVEVVHRGLCHEPSGRYLSAAAFAAALEPFTGGTTRVRTADLHRASREPGAAISGSGSHRTPASLAPPRPAPAPTPAQPRADARPWIYAAAATLLIVGLLLVAARGFGWLGGGGAGFEVRVPIEPASASVTVDARAQPLANGDLILTGEPGDTFTVRVSAGGAVVETIVTLTRSGRAVPDHIALSPSQAPR